MAADTPGESVIVEDRLEVLVKVEILLDQSEDELDVFVKSESSVKIEALSEVNEPTEDGW